MSDALDKKYGFQPIGQEEQPSMAPGSSPEDQQAIASFIEKPEPGLLDQASAGLESVGRGATLGFTDELAGVTGATGEQLARGLGMSDIPSPPGDSSLERMKNLYQQYRDAARAREVTQEEQFPATTFAGEMAGGFALPGGAATKGIQQLSKGAQMAKLAGTGAATGGLVGAGVSEASSPEELLQDVGTGAGIGTLTMGLGIPAAQKVGSVGGKIGQVIKEIPAIRGTLEMFQRGLGGQKLVGTEAAQGVGTEMAEFGMDAFKKLIGTSKDPGEVLRSGKLREEILKNAKASGQDIPIEKVDEIINELREKLLNIKDLAPGAQREAAQLQELVDTAKEGKEVQRLKKEALPLKENPIEQKEHILRDKLVQEKGINPEDISSEFVKTDDPNIVVGRVIQKTKGIDPVEEMQQALNLRRSKIEAEGLRPTDLEVKFESTDDPNISIGRIIQRTRDAEGVETGLKVLDQKKFDKRDLSAGTKVLAQKEFQTSELGPQFRESMETVREGGRDLTSPEQVDVLRQGIGGFAKMGDKPAQSREVLGAASEATSKLSKTLQEAVPEYGATTTKFGAAKDAVKSIGIEDASTPQEARDKLIGYLNQLYKDDATGIVAKERLKDFRSNLKIANPELEQQMGPVFEELSRKYELARETTKPGFLLLGGLTPRGAGYAAGNLAGRALHTLGQMAPEGIRSMASKVASKGTSAATGFARVLEQAATKDMRGRNALFFSLMQNPSYRKMMEEASPELFQQEEE